MRGKRETEGKRENNILVRTLKRKSQTLERGGCGRKLSGVRLLEGQWLLLFY